MKNGYFHHPLIYKDKLYFVSEEDLWAVNIKGGVPLRLTQLKTGVFSPILSRNGKMIAFSSREEGAMEIFIMSSDGGEIERVTFLGAISLPAAWTDNNEIIFSSNYQQPLQRIRQLFKTDLKGSIPENLHLGEGTSITFGPKKGMVIGRNTGDPARWKRYKGGTVGELWIDKKGNGNFVKLMETGFNLTNPMWIDDKIYFISDREGIGNIYSCNLSGRDIKKHTDNKEFYARNASTDGRKIVFQAGGDIYAYDVAKEKTIKIPINYKSTRSERQRRYIQPERFIQGFDLAYEGKGVAINSRGKVFTSKNWDGPVLQLGHKPDVRYRLARFLSNQERIILVSDETGEEQFYLYSAKTGRLLKKLSYKNVGRILEIEVSPNKKDEKIVFTTHRNEVYLLDIKTETFTLVDKSKFDKINGISFSPDGKWIAYGFSDSNRTSIIKLYSLSKRRKINVTEPVSFDKSPSFDPDGKFLYFISYRDFNPLPDEQVFDLCFPYGSRPYLVPLQKNTLDPFLYIEEQDGPKKEENKNKKPSESNKLTIDTDNMNERIRAFPVPEGRYLKVRGAKEKAVFLKAPLKGMLSQNFFGFRDNFELIFWDFKKRKLETISNAVSDFRITFKGEHIIYLSKNRLRISSVEKSDPQKDNLPPGAESGWYDFKRIKLLVYPKYEWRQMLKEAWRLQRDHFWREDIGKIDWKKIFKRYYSLLDRINTRGELSDVIWEMQGELGTSHCYEFGGDYPVISIPRQGLLGADILWDNKNKGYKITHILKGDFWDKSKSSPLTAPGIDVKEGDLLVEINNIKLTKELNPYKILINHANTDVFIKIKRGTKIYTYIVRPIPRESMLRYREWVEKNREYVHKKTKNRIGYVHIPDMGAWGYSEFHRYYGIEAQLDGIIIDVRYNGGGFVSQLLLSKLMQKRIGYDLTRWQGKEPYFYYSVKGPIVAITNELAGSDGDIFSHSFKLLKIGKLIGKRTWGGVVGINPSHPLIDGTITTQPEFAFWFKDVGWGVENYGTDPDIPVENRPQDYKKDFDAQLERAIKEAVNGLKSIKMLEAPKKPGTKIKLPTLLEK